MGSFRVVVVDDSALFRTILRNVLASIADCEMIASVGDGRTAIEKICELRPDMVTLDLEMPDVNGLEVLRELKRRKITSKIVMISRHTGAGAQVTTDALIEGAFDFILKPSGLNPQENKAVLLTALQEKISAIREASAGSAELDSANSSRSSVVSHAATPEAVVIGCSTGGPDALARVIPELPADLPVPVFIVQHMPPGFTSTLAARLNEASQVDVFEAEDGREVCAGEVMLAKGGSHLQLERRSSSGVIVKLSNDPHEHGCRPAVDFTLRSAVELLEGHLLTVILTGMGRDGTAGCQLVRSAGGRVLAQHHEGCTVYGMPKAVVQAGLANEVVKLSKVAQTIAQLTRK